MSSSQMSENRFHEACEILADSISSTIDRLNNREERIHSLIEAINNQGIEVLRIVDLAKAMTLKAPMCATILTSPPGYFVQDFKQACMYKVIPALYLAVHALKKCDKVDADVYFKTSELLEQASDDMLFALDSQE